MTVPYMVQKSGKSDKHINRKEPISRSIDVTRVADKPEGHDEQHNLASFTCFTASPIIHDPTLTSSWAYVRRTDLHRKKGSIRSIKDITYYYIRTFFMPAFQIFVRDGSRIYAPYKVATCL